MFGTLGVMMSLCGEADSVIVPTGVPGFGNVTNDICVGTKRVRGGNVRVRISTAPFGKSFS